MSTEQKESGNKVELTTAIINLIAAILNLIAAILIVLTS